MNWSQSEKVSKDGWECPRHSSTYLADGLPIKVKDYGILQLATPARG